MKISYQNKTLDVVKTSNKVRVTSVGTRSIYQELTSSQRYVKCFSKWWKFPQEIDY